MAREVGPEVVPNDLRQLRACMFCSLVKTFAQFDMNGCDNCAFLELKGDRNRVLDFTSSSFEGLISMMEPSQSWVAKWQRIGSFTKGCYAVQVNGKVPDDMLAEISKQTRLKPRVK